MMDKMSNFDPEQCCDHDWQESIVKGKSEKAEKCDKCRATCVRDKDLKIVSYNVPISSG